MNLNCRYVLWEVNSSCNLNCLHCRVNEITEENLIEGEMVDKLINEISELKIPVLTLTGGEPLLREDLSRIVSLASNKGIKVRVQTNGTLLTEKKIDELVDAGVHTFGIGLDGSTPTIHEKLRNKKGVFDLAIKAIKLVKSRGVKLHIESTINQYNKDDMINVIRLANSLGADCFLTRCVTPAGKAEKNLGLMLSKEEYKKVLSSILEERYKSNYDMIISSQDPLFHLLDKKLINQLSDKYGDLESGKFIGGCIAGFNSLNIISNGKVKLCSFLPVVVGDVNNESLVSIWEHIEDNETVKKLRNRVLSGDCGVCSNKWVCGGCRARALVLNGSILASDPYCFK